MTFKPSIFVGDKFLTTRCGVVTVVEYTNYQRCAVEFEDGTVVTTTGDCLRDGHVTNPYFPITCGLGYYGVPEEGRVYEYAKQSYSTWNAMMQRCHNPVKRKTHASYEGCWVNPEWYNFQNYLKWYQQEYKPGWHMDKDIAFKGNKEYSKDTVFCVPPEVNGFLVLRTRDRGKWPIGVTQHRGQFYAQHSMNGKQRIIGVFNNHMDAFNSYKVAKEARARELAEKYKGQVNDKVIEGLLNYRVEIDD